VRFIAAAFAVLLLAPATASAGEIVVFEDGRDARTETTERARALGIDVEHRYSRAVKGFAADLTPEQVAELRRDPDVAEIVEDRRVFKLGTAAAQPGETIPPGIGRATRAPAGEVHGAATHSVAVLDSGADLDHPDLNLVAGANCTGAGAPEDADGHGTHVAGIIGAEDDGQGIVGVAPGTRIVVVKVLDDTGEGSVSTVLCGIEWVLAHAAEYDIRVTNMSLGGLGDHSTCDTDPEHLANCRLAAAGIVPVVAAGNNGWDLGETPPDVPASFPEVLTVAAMADTDGLPGGLGPAASCDPAQLDDTSVPWSSYTTREVDAAHLVAAPGVCIRSTFLNGGYATMDGTSMAAPHVAGLVGLCLGEAGAIDGPCAGLGTAQVISHMVLSARAAEGNGFAGDFSAPLGGRDYGAMAVLPTAPPVKYTPTITPVAGGGDAEPAPMPAPALADVAPVAEDPLVPVTTPRATLPSVALALTARGALRRLRSRAGLRVVVANAVAGTVTIHARNGRLLGRGLVRAGRAAVRPTQRARRLRRRVVVAVTAVVRSTDGRVVRLTRRIALR
jgi:subtilisin family serine protease